MTLFGLFHLDLGMLKSISEEEEEESFMRENGWFLFMPLSVKGVFYLKSMEIGIIEGAIALIRKHFYKAQCDDLYQNIDLFIKLAKFEEWMLWYIL